MSIADLLIAIKELQLNKIYAPAVLTKKYLEESVFAQAEAHISFIRIVKWSLYLNRGSRKSTPAFPNLPPP